MTYTEDSFILNVPVEYVFQHLNNPQNFSDVMLGKEQKVEYLETPASQKEQLAKGDTLQVKQYYNNSIVTVEARVVDIVKDQKIHYKYRYINYQSDSRFVDKEEKVIMLKSMNKVQMEGFWLLEDVGDEGTRINHVIEMNGKISMVDKIMLWFQKRKTTRETTTMMKSMIEKIERDFDKL